MTEYTLRYTETAREDLRKIAFSLYDLTGSNTIVTAYMNGIRESCAVLKMFPGSGFVPRDRTLVAMGYRFVQYRDYLAFYLRDDVAREITVMTVFNGKMDYTAYMRRYLFPVADQPDVYSAEK